MTKNRLDNYYICISKVEQSLLYIFQKLFQKCIYCKGYHKISPYCQQVTYVNIIKMAITASENH